MLSSIYNRTISLRRDVIDVNVRAITKADGMLLLC